MRLECGGSLQLEFVFGMLRGVHASSTPAFDLDCLSEVCSTTTL